MYIYRASHQPDMSRGIRADDAQTADELIEDYLDHLMAPLVGEMPYRMRVAVRDEMASHLRAVADAYVELGSEPDAAARDAIGRFGSAGLVARRWMAELDRHPAGGIADAPSAVAHLRSQRAALRWFGAAAGLSALTLLHLPGHILDSEVQIQYAAAVCLSAVAGMIVGWSTRIRPAWSVVRAMSVLALPMVGTYVAWAWWRGWDYWPFWGFVLGALQVTAWSWVGTCSASAVYWARTALTGITRRWAPQ